MRARFAQRKHDFDEADNKQDSLERQCLEAPVTASQVSALYLSSRASRTCSQSPAMESPKGLEGMLSEPRTSAVSKGLVGEVAKTCREAPSSPSSEVLNSRERTRSLGWSSA